MGKIVFGVAGTEFQAEAIVNELKVAEFPDENISVLVADKVAAKTRSGAPPGVGGGTLGWLPGIEMVSVPGAGSFIASGPILVALGGSAVGGQSGGIGDALEGMGLAEGVAGQLERKVRGGEILIAIHSDSDSQSQHARGILEQAQARGIAATTDGASHEAPGELNLGDSEAQERPAAS